MAVDMIAALDRLREMYPVGPVSLEVECWDYEPGRRKTEWSVWISNEADSERGSRSIAGRSLDEVMAKVEAEAANPPTKDCEVIVDNRRVDPAPVNPDDDAPF